MITETPAILAAEMMESGGLSWGNASLTSIRTIANQRAEICQWQINIVSQTDQWTGHEPTYRFRTSALASNYLADMATNHKVFKDDCNALTQQQFSFRKRNNEEIYRISLLNLVT